MEIKKKAIRIGIILCIGLLTFLFLRNNQGTTEPISKRQAITIKWMVPGEKYKASNGVFADFNKQLKKYLPDTSVEFEVIQKENYKEKWDMKMATNETLDLAWIGTDMFNYVEEVKKGSFMALGYLLETYGEDLRSQVADELWKQQQKDGNTYSIPLPGILYRKSTAVVTKKTLADEFGSLNMIGRINRSKLYTDQQSFDAFEGFLKNLQKNRELGTGISYQTFGQLADKGYEGIYGSNSPFVIRIFDNKLVVHNKYELSSWKIYFKTMADWYQKGFIRSDVKGILNPSSDDGKFNGTMVFIDDYGKNGAVSDTVRTEYEKLVEPLENYKYVSYGACRNSIVIPKSAEHPQRAMELMNLLYSEKGKGLYHLLSNGVEGIHYTMQKDNLILRKLDEKGMPLYFLPGQDVGNVFHNFETSPGQQKQIQEYNQKAMVSPLSGFELDTRMFILEMAKVNLIVDEYKEKLSQGTYGNWETLYSEFLTGMQKAGSTKVIGEMQKQLDQFVKNKDKSKYISQYQ